MTASCSTRRGGGRKQKMVKNMKHETKNEQRDNVAAIGIGAMIVFIALILVAAVAAAVIIQTAEKLQQNAQTTGEDTTDMMASKITVKSVVIVNTNDLYVTFELAPGSDPVTATTIQWLITCDLVQTVQPIPATLLAWVRPRRPPTSPVRCRPPSTQVRPTRCSSTLPRASQPPTISTRSTSNPEPEVSPTKF